MDPNYWVNLAAQWIQQRNTNIQPMVFPSQMPQMAFELSYEVPTPAPPRISFIEHSSDANLIETDMDIEDEKDNDQQQQPPPPPPWIQQSIKSSPPWKSNNRQQQNKTFPAASFNSSIISTSNPPPNYRPNVYNNQHDTSGNIQSIDMDLDSGNEEENGNSEVDQAALEAKKRKKLPAWIREALEQRERDMNAEKERMELEEKREKEEEQRKKDVEEALREIEREKRRQRQESESEYDDEDEHEVPQNENDIESELEDSETIHEQMVIFVRKQLTEILLEVTDKMIQEISRETHMKLCKKASSVTSIRPSGLVNSGLLGGAYSDSSDDDSDDDTNDKIDDKNNIESESIILDRIRSKSHNYRQKSREIKHKLARLEELENQIFNIKPVESEPASRDQSDNDESLEKNQIGEEKYEKNNSIAGSFARHKERVKKSRFNDLKDRSTTLLITHVNMMNSVTSAIPSQLPNTIQTSKIDERQRSKTPSSSTSSSDKSKKHKKKKHKKSSKHSKKSSRKRSRSRSRSKHRRDRSRSKDRHSIESKSSIRSSESRRRRSRSRSRDKHRSRRY